jgi:hypothetical protein
MFVLLEAREKRSRVRVAGGTAHNTLDAIEAYSFMFYHSVDAVSSEVIEGIFSRSFSCLSCCTLDVRTLK